MLKILFFASTILLSSCIHRTNIIYSNYSEAKQAIKDESFVKIETTMKAKIVSKCVNPENVDASMIPSFIPICGKVIDVVSTGSGFVVKRIKVGSYVMTAEHVCDTNDLPRQFELISASQKVITLDKKEFVFKIVRADKTNDVCLVYVEGMISLPPVLVADEGPREKDRVYNVAAPRGVVYDTTAPIYTGYYVGRYEKYDAYSLQANPGSSGSPIFNRHGRLIGMVTRGASGFQSALGPNFYVLRNFILETLQVIIL